MQTDKIRFRLKKSVEIVIDVRYDMIQSFPAYI